MKKAFIPNEFRRSLKEQAERKGQRFSGFAHFAEFHSSDSAKQTFVEQMQNCDEGHTPENTDFLLSNLRYMFPLMTENELEQILTN